LPVPPSAAGAVAASAVPAHAVLAWERTARRRIALAYLLAVCLCALLLALVYAYFSGWHVLSSFVLVMALAYAMAAVPMIAVTLAWPFWRGAAAALALLVVGAIIVFAFAMVERSLLGRPIGVAQLGLRSSPQPPQIGPDPGIVETRQVTADAARLEVLGDAAAQIVPVIVGSADGAVALAARLADDGLFVPAIRPPSVPAGGSLVRASLSCHHTDDDLDRLARALSEIRE
jgi:hypothetical protein